MGPLLERWLIRAGKAIAEEVAAKSPLNRISERIGGITRSVLPMASAREAAILTRASLDAARRIRKSGDDDPGSAAERLTRVCVIRELEKAANAVDRSMQAKAKAQIAAETIHDARSAAQPCVFYLVSGHQNPAAGHRDLQYSLCVDRYWRKTLTEAGFWWLADEVGRLIRIAGIPSAQRLMGPPCYLITRPYCRHRLIPLGTMEVLACDGDAKALRSMHPEAADGAHRTLTDAQRYAAYRKRRAEIRKRAAGKTKNPSANL